MQNLPVSRNPKLTINGKTVQTIGDVHLGRSYINGVPIHMRGKMEKKQRDAFVHLLDTATVDYLVVVGDLFDSFIVDPSDVDFAVTSVLQSARKYPSRTLVVLGGNHDESKDLTRKSSFDNFKLALKEAAIENLSVIEQPTVIDGMGFISWSARYSAKELAEQLIALKTVTGYINEGHGNVGEDYSLYAVFGHWDVNLPENANHYNMVPTQQLKAVTDLIITGHVHKPDVVERDNVQIVITGSMLPLAHGEELEEDKMFFTVTREEYDKEPAKYENTFVRFILKEDEELPEGNFLQIKAYVKPTRQAETDSVTDTFDLASVLDEFLEKEGIDETLRASVVERFKARNASED